MIFPFIILHLFRDHMVHVHSLQIVWMICASFHPHVYFKTKDYEIDQLFFYFSISIRSYIAHVLLHIFPFISEDRRMPAETLRYTTSTKCCFVYSLVITVCTDTAAVLLIPRCVYVRSVTLCSFTIPYGTFPQAIVLCVLLYYVNEAKLNLPLY